ncbi:hypothetical protein [Sporosarcina cascadiensis]|uniref:hypothetical protein n=1 Tax=Sporosarcina cascadiensis TaxID=2660747 RepID=UPI00129A592D|nr:hypothetical protein [Sporosarcina cascadiensis]
MASISKLISISILVFSIALSILLFYLMSELPKEQKKKMVDEMVSQLINFVLFMWAGKVLLNLSVFITDPMAILAYPGDSGAFYAAVLFSGLLLSYKVKRGHLEGLAVGRAFVHLYLSAAFLYEFIQYTWNDQIYSLRSLILLAILLGVFTYLNGRMATGKLLGILLTVWTFGMAVLLTIQPYVTVFGYMIKPWFLLLFFAANLLLLILQHRKEGRYGWN